MVSLRDFDTPKESIRWAREATNELETGLDEFFREKIRPPLVAPCKPYTKIVDIDPKTGNHVHKLRFYFPFPGFSERRANEALQNVRNSFDQAIFSACTILRKVPRRGNLHFPWCTTPNDLTARLRNGPIPSELWEVISRERPYPTGSGYFGGNDTIREVAKLANGKHTVGLKLLTRSAVIKPPNIMTRRPWVEVSRPGWNVMKNEIFLCHVPPGSEVHDNYKINLQVAFNEPAPVGDVAAVQILRQFADRAKLFAEALEAKCASLLG